MFGLGLWEILIILALALVVIGPKKLPDIAASIGRGLRDLRRATDEIRHAVDVTPPHRPPPPPAPAAPPTSPPASVAEPPAEAPAEAPAAPPVYDDEAERTPPVETPATSAPEAARTKPDGDTEK